MQIPHEKKNPAEENYSDADKPLKSPSVPSVKNESVSGDAHKQRKNKGAKGKKNKTTADVMSMSCDLDVR